METVIKAVCIETTELNQKGVGIAILPYCFFLCLTELILSSLDFFLFILKHPLQHLRLLL